MRHIETTVVDNIIFDLENQHKNVDIAKKYNVSVSLVEKINGCKIYTDRHNYKINIRNENKPVSEYRKNVINEYIEHKDYYELHIVNTRNIEVFSKIDKEDYCKISNHKWTLSIHNNDIRIIANEERLKRIALSCFIMGNENQEYVIDHINQDPLDNRKINLRVASRAINSINAKPREGKYEIRGVYKRKERPGISKECWVCEWTDINHKRHSKSYSIPKYGEETAYRLAVNLREEKLKEMKI